MNKIINSLLLLVFAFSMSAKAQNYNRPVTDQIFPYEFQIMDSTTSFYYALGPFKLYSTPSDPDYLRPKALILDPKGYTVWYGFMTGSVIMMDFKYDSGSDQFSSVNRIGGTSGIALIDTNFTVQEEFTNVSSDYLDGHDFKRLSDGNFALLGVSDSLFDLSAYTFNGSPGSASTICRCNTVEIVDISNNLIWDWNSCNYLHPSEGYDHYGYNISSYDYAHINSVFEDDDGHLILSFRHMNSVVKISRTTGNVIWRLGGKLNDFTFTNDVGFTGQHNAERRPSGRISVFDNGQMSGPPEFSRGLEYVIDTSTWSATLVDDFQYSPTTFGSALGSNYRLDGSKVINYGMLYRPEPSFVVVDSLNQVQATAYFPDSVMNYRVQPFHPGFEFDRPTVTCLDSAGTTFLVAEPGHSVYLWSSGENTQIIEPLVDSVYQVWVPQGFGKISCPPIHYSATYCAPTEIAEHNRRPARLIKTIDLLGREIKHKSIGQLYIEVYSDGSIKKIVSLQQFEGQ
ncbi:MAG: hypothetical protein ACI9J3_000271 [Parvicellaceae bacterium]|jgi:hypothetical protein